MNKDREKKSDENCDHVWKQTGYWDGRDKHSNRVGGPTAKCTKCEGSKRFDWGEWRAIPEEKRIELNPRRNND